MTFRFTESRDSRKTSANPISQTLVFTAAGSNDAAYVLAYATAATSSVASTVYGTLYRQDIQVDPLGFEVWKVTVPYATAKRETGSYRLSFDTTGGTVHVTASKETLGKYAKTGETAPDYKQLIGVNGEDVGGADIVIPALKLTCHYKHPAAVISLSRIKYLANITGTVNSSTFLTFAAGEVLFLGCSGAEGTDAETEIQYQFACSANAASLTIGEIADVVKRGHDLAWIKYQDATDTAGGTTYPVKKPQFAYVERMYEEIDLALALGIS
jgi:hypothetical protein